jgi:hypothetical protein
MLPQVYHSDVFREDDEDTGNRPEGSSSDVLPGMRLFLMEGVGAD